MVLLLRDSEKAEILAGLKAIENSFAAYHHNFRQCLIDLDSRFAILTKTTFLPPLSLPLQPTIDDLPEKLEFSTSVSAVRVVGPTEPPSPLPLSSTTSVAVPFPLQNTDSLSIHCPRHLQFPHHIPTDDLHFPLKTLSENSQNPEPIGKFCFQPPLIPTSVSQIKPTADFILSLGVTDLGHHRRRFLRPRRHSPAPPWFWLIICTEPIFRVFSGRTMVIWIEEPPGSHRKMEEVSKEDCDYEDSYFLPTDLLMVAGTIIVGYILFLPFSRFGSTFINRCHHHLTTLKPLESKKFPRSGSWDGDPRIWDLQARTAGHRFADHIKYVPISGFWYIHLSKAAPLVTFNSPLSYFCTEIGVYLVPICLVDDHIWMAPLTDEHEQLMSCGWGSIVSCVCIVANYLQIFKGSVIYAWITVSTYPSYVTRFMLCSTEGPPLDFKSTINPRDADDRHVKTKGSIRIYSSEIYLVVFCLVSFVKKGIKGLHDAICVRTEASYGFPTYTKDSFLTDGANSVVHMIMLPVKRSKGMRSCMLIGLAYSLVKNDALMLGPLTDLSVPHSAFKYVHKQVAHHLEDKVVLKALGMIHQLVVHIKEVNQGNPAPETGRPVRTQRAPAL